MNRTEKNQEKFNELRRIAEEILNKTGPQDMDKDSLEIDHLIEELQIHQIELEHQNKELLSTQETLQQTKERYRDLYELAPVGYFTLRKDGTILEVNRTGAAMLRTEKVKITGVGFHRFVLSENRKEFHSHTQEVVGSHTRKACELKLNRMDGKEFFARLDSIRVGNNRNGEIRMRTAVTNISAEKKAVQNLRFQSQVLKSAGEAVIAADLNGKISYWSPAAERLYGWKKEEVLGRYFLQFHPAPSSQNQVREIMDLVKQENSWNGEYRARNAEGHEFPVFATSTPFYDEKGLQAGVLVISRDMSERKKLQNELVSARIKAEESSKLKSMFLATMSHEIRTPLNAVIGFLDIVLSGDVSSKEREEYLSKAKASSKFLLKLINDILDFSKIEAEQIEINPQTFSLMDLMNRVFHRTLMLIRKKDKDIDLRKNISEKIASEITMDPFRLEQIFSNLLSNAVKFTEKGRIEFGVEIEPENADIPEPMLKFYIRDTGIGIPDEQRMNIFEPFVQAGEESHIKYGGTGLGLAISKRLVKAMGGEIEIESEEGKGTTICFTLPYQPGDETASPKPEPEKPRKSRTGRKGVILLAEDEKINQLAIKTILEKSGYTVLTAENGNQALEVYRKNLNIDAVLLDRRMPDLNGIETARCLKEMEKETDREKIPVIALTASVQPEDREDMLSAGCDAFLAKPIEWQELIDCLDKYL